MKSVTRRRRVGAGAEARRRIVWVQCCLNTIEFSSKTFTSPLRVWPYARCLEHKDKSVRVGSESRRIGNLAKECCGEFLTSGREVGGGFFPRRWCFSKEELELEAGGRTDLFRLEGVPLAQTRRRDSALLESKPGGGD